MMTGSIAILRGRVLASVVACAVVVTVAACGGGGGGGGSSSSSTGSTPPVTQPAPPPVTTSQPNTLAVTVDAGPPALAATTGGEANVLFATIMVCSPGTTACRTVDHVQVDTGSTGLRLLSSALGAPVVPTAVTDAGSGRPLFECVQFADGYSYGSVAAVDVTIGSRTIASLPIQIIGDPAAGTAPSTCVSGPAENTVNDFGANGVLGIGNFMQDCGPACAQQAVSGTYYICSLPAGGSSCSPVSVALARQVPNPVSRMTTDNNGVLVSLPGVPSPGATSLSGTVFFGVGTQTNNGIGSARIYQLTSVGTFAATANGQTYQRSFIDTGSNAYFYTANNIAVCSDGPSFYCPVTSSNVRTSISQTATITGTNAATATISFVVDNADQLFSNATFTVFPGLAGPNGSLANQTGGFDFGLPFFFGRNVAILIEGSSLSGVAGPAVAF